MIIKLIYAFLLISWGILIIKYRKNVKWWTWNFAWAEYYLWHWWTYIVLIIIWLIMIFIWVWYPLGTFEFLEYKKQQ